VPRLLGVLTLVYCTSCREEPPADSEEATKMAKDSHVHHAIDYVEFAVTDMAQSKRFYQVAFDWTFNDYGPEYAGIQKEGGEAGGFRLEPEAAAGGPLVILYSNDLDATIARVRAAGGRISREPFEFPGGRRFHFEDPSGNELAVWSER
jgi:predicted enzyme related to lactoylglutathione lyase